MSGGLRLPSLVGDEPEPDKASLARGAATEPAAPRFLRWSERAAAALDSAPLAASIQPPVPAVELDPFAGVWSGAVCAPEGDRTLLLADWIVVASGMRGTVVEATTLGSSPDAPHGMYLDASDPERADSQLADLPRPGLAFAVTGEHTELARLLRNGYLDPSRTVLVIAARRALSHAELTVSPEHVLEDREIETLASRSAARLVRCDIDQVCAWHELPASSGPGILLGALCAVGAAGLDEALCHAAIVQLGIDVPESLEGFAIGLRIGAGRGSRGARRGSSAAQFVRRTRGELPRDEREPYRQLIEHVDTAFVSDARDAVREAVRALTSYQSTAYAQIAVDHCAGVLADQARSGIAPDTGGDIVPTVARCVTQILLHPDIAWAAQVRGARTRLPELRDRHGLRRDQPYSVIDHLQLDEREVAELRRAAQRRRPGTEAPRMADPALAAGLGPVGALSVQTVTLRGQLQLRQLAALRRGRPYTAYYARALETCVLYVAATREAFAVDPDLGALVARSGSMVYGAGAVRTATSAAAVALWGRVVRPAISVDRHAGAVGAPFASLVVRWTLGELVRIGPRAIWDVNGQVLGIALSTSRGGSHADAMAFAHQLTGE